MKCKECNSLMFPVGEGGEVVGFICSECEHTYYWYEDILKFPYWELEMNEEELIEHQYYSDESEVLEDIPF